MILDNHLLLSGAVSAAGVLSGQAVAGTDTSVLSTNTLDTGPLALGSNQPNNPGAGEELKIAFSILTAPTTGTSAKFELIQADDAALTSGVEVLASTGAIPNASLTAGTLLSLDYPSASPLAAKRYVGVRYVLAGISASMVVTAAIVKDVASVKNMLYRSGFAVT